jgi:acyl-CoA reductase-like NAD-dependent aldehyde dehydrogenase
MPRDYHMLIGGQWLPGKTRREVTNKYDGSVLGTIPMAEATDIDQALSVAQQTFPTMAAMPAYQRADILSQAVDLLKRRREEIARTIAAKAGKALKFARVEADRGIQTFTFLRPKRRSAFTVKRCP